MKIHLIVCLILFAFSSIAQIETIKIKSEPEVTPCTFAETPAEFPGGFRALLKFVSSNMNLPLSSYDLMCITIYANFTITKDGDVTDAKILKGATACPPCDDEALRMINSMPKWKPAIDKGKPVATYFNLPIRIRIH